MTTPINRQATEGPQAASAVPPPPPPAMPVQSPAGAAQASASADSLGARGNGSAPTLSLFPPGAVGYLANYLYRYAPSPVPEYSIATAIGFFAGICGRGWNTHTGTGLNHDIVVLGQSGTGKNIVHQGIANIVKQLDGTPIRSFIFNGAMASAQALTKYVATKPCSVQLIGEVGKMYRAYSKCRYGDNIHQLFTAKLDLWERSGPDGTSTGIMYSDSEKNIEGGVIAGIAHSTLGDSTPEVFYGALNEDMMNEGLLSRLWIFEYVGEDPDFNKDRLERLPDDWLNYLRSLVQEAARRHALAPQSIQCSPEAERIFDEFMEACKEGKATADSPAVRQIWVRAYEKAIRLAGLLAVADNYSVPVIQEQHAGWAVSAVASTNANIFSRIGEEIAGDSDHTREQMIRDRCWRWLKEPRRDQKEEKLRNQAIITKRFLQQEVQSKEVFRNHRLGAVGVFNLTMKSLCDQGYLVEMKKGEAKVDGVPYLGQCWSVIDK